ncbi:fibronectin type III domain-containing protein [Microbacterium sp. CFH 90308]|uniref:Fibronectin type III domain-containing protein n=1 Tax=Microbacterium salsuginis TaxID=2722803 RepID=A0ABX1K883_9MICO|nr:fibronectin type III domain-containing protein [Microbacterium sp. CFH 90308]NLP83233.1 fibronectin type III domain-containing protein [Microbacterium sp. CFH 90308]
MHGIERARGAVWGVLVACLSLFIVAPSAAAETGDDAAIPEYLDIPVVLIETGGSFLPATYISVNGSDPIFVSVDTGTSGLVLDPGAIQNPATPVVNTDIPAGENYDGTSVRGFLAHATVTIQGVDTEREVAFVNGTECPTACPGAGTGTRGVLGIGPGIQHYPGGDANLIYTAIDQMPGRLDEGFTVDFTGSSPHVRLGPIGEPAPQDTVIQRTQKASEVKPNGQRVFLDPMLCWTITAGPQFAQDCNTTVLDTGQTLGIIHGDEFDPVVDPSTAPPIPGSGIQLEGWVKTGATVAWSVSPTTEPFAGVTQADALPIRYGQFTIAPNMNPADAIFNAGNHFYTQHVVGFNSVSGGVVIGPVAGLPPTPGSVVAHIADGGAVTVRWADGESHTGGVTGAAATEPITGFVVSAIQSDGTVVQSSQAAADARDLTLAGLSSGASYRFRVAAVNAVGLGRAAESEPVALPASPASPSGTGGRSELAASGGSPSGILTAAVLLAAGAAAAGLGRARVRAASAGTEVRTDAS